MTFSNISYFRLANQQIGITNFHTVKDIVTWMGAMQAQDYLMAKWAIGIRMPGATDKIVETAIDKGEIIRTHLLRPTWHFVSASDIHWMLELTAPQIKTSLKTRQKQLGLTGPLLSQCNSIIEKALTDGKHLTRDELKIELERAKIFTGERLSHIMFWAEMEGLVCSGASKNGKQTYTLLSEWVPKTKSLSKEEALASLAKRYFTSHGPATLQDFTWWSGLSVGNAKNALELVNPHFISETIDGKIYWFSYGIPVPARLDELVYVLPAYDEFIISYKDRIAVLSPAENKKAISDNGIFRPVIIINGQAVGIWKRTIKKDQVVIETNFFKSSGAKKLPKDAIAKAFQGYGKFLGLKVEIVKHIGI
jgi:hypothetical protein